MHNLATQPVEMVKALEYVLDDYLEIKARLNVQKARPLKKFLFSLRARGSSIESFEGFCWNEQIVLLRGGDPQLFKHLVFLNPGDGRIQVKGLLKP